MRSSMMFLWSTSVLHALKVLYQIRLLCCRSQCALCVRGRRRVTEEAVAMIKFSSVLGATCCKPEEPVVVDKCCSEKAPVCACGSQCVTAEQAATLRCTPFH